jgi:hypothetical protein
MTSILRIEHAVGDFGAWKRAFDGDPLGRKKSGVRRYRVLRPADNPGYVMIDLEFDGSKDAEAFAAALRRMWGTAEAQKIMQNPQLKISELVETKEL